MNGPYTPITIRGRAFMQPWIVTPLIRSAFLSRIVGCEVLLKLENLQPSGSFKSRGIGNFLLSKLEEFSEGVESGESQRPHFFSSSGGNAGLGCVHAATTLGCPSTVVVPMTTTDDMIDKIRKAGATAVTQHGASWAEADRYLVETVMPEAASRGAHAVYVHPFDEPKIWEGHSTMVHEVVSQLENNKDHGSQIEDLSNGHDVCDARVDAWICSVGGGGLFCGIMQGIEAVRMKDTRVLALETHGADSLAQSLEQGRLVTLPGITSIATSLGARTVAKQAFEYGQRPEVESVVLSDTEAINACIKFAEHERIMIEPACGVCVAACLNGSLRRLLPDLSPSSRIVVVVCGGSNVSPMILQKWMTNGDRCST